MGKYDTLIKEDLSRFGTPAKKIRDIENHERGGLQTTIEIVSNSPCKASYNNSVKDAKEKIGFKEPHHFGRSFL